MTKPLSLVLYAIAGILAVILLTVLLRALFIRRKPAKTEPAERIFDPAVTGVHLGRMIRCRTYERPGVPPAENTELDRLRRLLAYTYPALFAKGSPEVINGCGLMLRLSGNGTGKQPVVYMAHYDVVPAGDDWDFEPFSGDIADGVVRGRGAIDTKITVCAILEALDRLVTEGFVPSRDIYLCFGGDEETDGAAAAAIADELEKRGVRPAMVLDEGGAVVEKVFPGVSCKLAMVGVCEKGIAELTLTARSAGGHGSTPPAKTPVDHLADAVRKINKKPFKTKLTKPVRMFFRAAAARASFGMRLIIANVWLFSPVLRLVGKLSGGELNALMRTTLAFTRASGSDAVNIIPSEASVTGDLRTLPGMSVEKAAKRVKRIVRRLPVEVSVGEVRHDPSPVSPVGGEDYRAICDTVSMLWEGCETVPYMLLGHSDSSEYTRICDRVYRFAPVFLTAEERGMIHGVNERIPAEKAALAADFYYYLTKKL